MASHYSIIRYVPDSVADERINIGIVAVGDGGPCVYMLNRWARARNFAAGLHESFLKDFGVALRDSNLTLEHLQHYANTWIHSIQFSEPRGSVLPTSELIDQIAGTFLREEAAVARPYRNRSQVTQAAVSTARKVMRFRFGSQGAAMVTRDATLVGHNFRHRFDLVVMNGATYFAAQSVSLQVPDQKQVEKIIDAAGWAIQDMRKQQSDLRTGILAVLPGPDQAINQDAVDNAERLKRVTGEVGADLIDEAGFASHFEQIADAIPVQPD